MIVGENSAIPRLADQANTGKGAFMDKRNKTRNTKENSLKGTSIFFNNDLSRSRSKTNSTATVSKHATNLKNR